MVGRTSILGAVALLAALFAGALPTHAQQRTCFAQTGHCIGGRFAQYWQQNGGLPAFGYPLTDELTEQGRTVQYFERQRFERAPENAAPYDVLLGLLGEEVLQQQGIDWQTQPVSPGPLANCLWFQQTQHNVCDQTPGSGFKRYWQTHGLEFDGRAGKSFRESLALFGLPVTEPFQDTVNGEIFQVQWFERARFEWHPATLTHTACCWAAWAPRCGRLQRPRHPYHPTQARTARPTCWHRTTTRSIARNTSVRTVIGRLRPTRTTNSCRATPTPPASS